MTEEMAETSEAVSPEVVDEGTGELTPADLGLSETEADELRGKAKIEYTKMQHSWFFFGKALSEIKNKDAFKSLGYDSFKAFCEHDYPELDYGHMNKMVLTCNEYGGVIQGHIEANPNSPIPPMESLYTVQTAQKKAITAKDDKAQRKVAGLLTKVLDGELSYYGLRTELDAMKPAKEEKSPSEEKESAKVEGIDVPEIPIVEGSEEEEIENLAAETDVSIDVLAERVDLALKPVREYVDMLGKQLRDDPEKFTQRVIDTMSAINELYNYFGEFLPEMEEISSAD